MRKIKGMARIVNRAEYTVALIWSRWRAGLLGRAFWDSQGACDRHKGGNSFRKSDLNNLNRKEGLRGGIST